MLGFDNSSHPRAWSGFASAKAIAAAGTLFVIYGHARGYWTLGVIVGPNGVGEYRGLQGGHLGIGVAVQPGQAVAVGPGVHIGGLGGQGGAVCAGSANPSADASAWALAAEP